MGGRGRPLQGGVLGAAIRMVKKRQLCEMRKEELSQVGEEQRSVRTRGELRE